MNNSAETKTQDHHYFASNMGRWMTGNDPIQLWEEISKSNVNGDFGPNTMILVPAPMDSHYQITDFRPIVDNAVIIHSDRKDIVGGYFDPKTRSKRGTYYTMPATYKS